MKEKLDQMECDSIIAKVDKPTDWVNSLVIVEKKDGSLRLCLDPKDLNKVIKREHFQIPTFEDVVSRLGEKKYFTVLDQKDSYWQVPLSEESSYMCTFNTPFGRYRFVRMPFGICSASEVLQKRVYKVFGDMQGVEVIADDMIISGATEEEHDQLLRNVMQRAREQNVKFNPKKVQFKQPRVVYFGTIISEDGIRPDPAKVKAMVELPQPTSKEDVRRLMGTVASFKDFIPDMSTTMCPIRQLLKKDVEFQWLPEHQQAIDKIKGVLSSEPVLRYYDPNKKVTIQADASSTGLGACLLQDKGPVAYASRALTETEQRWFQIEKELLAVMFAAEHFHHYIYGREVEVENDHKPLETIIRKPLQNASPRIQLMLLRLLRYKLNLKYVPGTKVCIADMLSRAHPALEPLSEDSQDEEMELRIHGLASSLPISGEKMNLLKQATASDETLQMVQALIAKGWPGYKSDTPISTRQYWPIRDELHVVEGLVFRGEKLVIPASMRGEMLIKLHESHLGMEKCKARARSIMYWPGMGRDIEETISRCLTCAKYKPANPREPLIPHEIPQRPWSKLGMDIFTFRGKDYLLVVDYYSKFPEVCHLAAKTATCVISHLKTCFARHGIPDTVIADNMPFGSREFTRFADEWGFEVKTSSPHHPASNGQSERSVGTIKQLMRKAAEEGRDIHLAMLEYRNTPISGLEYSPAQLLMSRMLKDKLPTPTTLLFPKLSQEAHRSLSARQERQRKYHDRGTKILPPLQVGDPVRIQQGRIWSPAVIMEKHEAPRSFRVRTNDGQVYRRNRKFLRHSHGSEPVQLVQPMSPASSTTAQPVQTTILAPPSPTPGAPETTIAVPTEPPTLTPQVPIRRTSDRLRNKPKWLEDYEQ